ncbi:MAG: endonuclease/exonuclease/phosphatase family protein, partial [Gammaproteobacteria bacterium]
TNIFFFLIFFIPLFYLLVYLSSYHPKAEQDEVVFCPTDTPLLNKSSPIKVMTWNIQFMAGKGYHFWFEPLDDSGPDKRPSRENICKTSKDIATIIERENPDIVLLQEVDDSAKRTDNEDQLQKLLILLPESYRCHTSCFYWKTRFLPHPKVMGATGMKLSIISKYKIKQAIRHSLPLVPKNWIVQQLGIKRAILEAHIPYSDGSTLTVMNSHLEAFSQGYDTLQRQVEKIKEKLLKLDKEKAPWIMGGDFNLLPPGQHQQLDDKSRQEFQEESELQLLYKHFSVLPSTEQLSKDKAAWLTYFANDPTIQSADRTLDYLLHSSALKCQKVVVNQTGGFGCSDHAPLTAEFSPAHDSDTTQSPA